jgi:hypothetical protein
MQTCTAPTRPMRIVLDPDGDPDFQEGWPCQWGLACGLLPGELAPPPPTCQGSEWPPATSWQRYGEDRAEGERIPPSVPASSWREQDRRRQAAAERSIREQGPSGEPRVVAWGPGPACDDRKAAE